jgi:acetylglutamate kinase
MEVVEMVLSGVVNKSLAAELTLAGVPAAGISGRDGNLLQAVLEPGLGRVGSGLRVDPALVRALWRTGYMPVVSPVSSGPAGESVNVNADEAALALATAFGAQSLVYLSDVDGVGIAGEPLPELRQADAEGHIRDGAISGGMALKVRAALDAACAGIPEVVIAGRARLTGGFTGTRIAGDQRVEARA